MENLMLGEEDRAEDKWDIPAEEVDSITSLLWYLAICIGGRDWQDGGCRGTIDDAQLGGRILNHS